METIKGIKRDWNIRDCIARWKGNGSIPRHWNAFNSFWKAGVFSLQLLLFRSFPFLCPSFYPFFPLPFPFVPFPFLPSFLSFPSFLPSFSFPLFSVSFILSFDSIKCCFFILGKRNCPAMYVWRQLSNWKTCRRKVQDRREQGADFCAGEQLLEFFI